MIQRVTIAFQDGVREAVWKHLRSNANDDEDAAFLFADAEPTAHGMTLHVRGWYGVVDDDFEAHGLAGIELSDACRAAMFKRAHDEERCLIECHSHPGRRPAVFSPYDFDGFDEFVPHVRWRLQNRPYAAIVVADTSFDALAWIDLDGAELVSVDAVTVGTEILYPTRTSLTRWKELHRGSPI